MKRQLKKMARRLWRMSAPVRRPLIRKLDHHMMHLLASFSPPPAPPPPAPPPPAPAVPDELELVFNSVVRELGRLQMQVEALQWQIDDLRLSDRDAARTDSRLSVLAEIG